MLLSQALENEYGRATVEDKSEGELKRLRQDFTDARKVEQAVETIGNVINGQAWQFVAEAIFGELQRTHRYLQSEIGRALLSVFARYADLKEFEYDARNEWLINAARDMRDRTPYIVK